MLINRVLRILLFICILGYVGNYSLYAQITHTVEFDESSLIAKDVIIGDSTYTELSLPNCFLDESILGNPQLPIKYFNFSVPYNAVDFTVTITNKEEEEYAIQHKIAPIQRQIIASEAILPELIYSNNAIYNTDNLWPNIQAQVIDEGFLDGSNHIITVAVYPIKYNPRKNSVLLTTNCTLNINYSNGNLLDSSNITTSDIIRPLASQREYGATITKEFVENPQQVNLFADQVYYRSNITSNITSAEIPTYTYCVITNRELAASFKKLVEWKKHKGIDAGIVCIEDILEHDIFQDGDKISSINDDAGKLRAYLQYSYNIVGNAKYVLFGGNSEILPIRYCTCTDNRKNYHNTLTPTDLYFSDLNGNWNVDGDMYYGEPTDDDLDKYPELFVGRLLCTSETEVNNYTKKLILYETNPGNGDYSYLKEGFGFQSDKMQKNSQLQEVADIIEPIISNFDILEEYPSYIDANPTFPTGANVIFAMNNNYSHFQSWNAHGNPGGISTKTNGDNNSASYGIIALESDGEEWFYRTEIGNGINNLTNNNYPSIVYSLSCDLAPFDTDTVGSTIYDVELNVGQSLTTGGLYGSVAFLGNSRYGLISHGHSLGLAFISRLNDGITNIGIAEAMSKSTFVDLHSVQTHHLIGDPEFEMWTDIPTLFNDIYIFRSENSITIEGASDSFIGIYSEGKPTLVESESYITTVNNVSPNSSIIIYKHNKIPYIAPIVLQNDSINSNRYFLADDIYIGRSVDDNRLVGNYIIKSGVENVIESNGDAYIESGLVIESDATLIINCKGTAEIENIDIMSGGKLIINAENINNDSFEIESNFTLETGATFELNYNGLVKILGGEIKNGADLTINSESTTITKDFISENGANIKINLY